MNEIYNNSIELPTQKLTLNRNFLKDLVKRSVDFRWNKKKIIDRNLFDKDSTGNFKFTYKIGSLKSNIALLKNEIAMLRKQNEELTSSLNKTRTINKELLLLLYKHGILDEKQSTFTFFKDVLVF